jgi:hypothetical protein
MSGPLFARKRQLAARWPAPTRPRLEELESRTLLSASALDPTAGLAAGPTTSKGAVVTPLLTVVTHQTSTSASRSAGTQVTNPNPVGGYTPTQIQQAYGFTSVYANNVGGNPQNGAGQAIAIVDAYNDPNVNSDLQQFESQYGMPLTSVTVVGQGGLGSSLPTTTNSGWALETSLDVEWAHAVAPGATIYLVEANSSSLSNLLAAVQTAANLAPVVSMSWGTNEFSGETTYDNTVFAATYPNPTTFLAASGDSGRGTIYPAVSPAVVGVGGTTATISGQGTASSPYSISKETAWGYGIWSFFFGGSGGGFSSNETEPSYQKTYASTNLLGNAVLGSSDTAGRRGSPDVAYNANPNTGYAIYDSTPYSGQSGWFEVGGTSAASPQWAGIIALANQGRVASGLTTLSSSGTLNALYQLGESPNYATSTPGGTDGYFHDITQGSNGYPTRAGYDLVTGLGSPQVFNIVGQLESSSTPPTGPLLVVPGGSTPAGGQGGPAIAADVPGTMTTSSTDPSYGAGTGGNTMTGVPHDATAQGGPGSLSSSVARNTTDAGLTWSGSAGDALPPHVVSLVGGSSIVLTGGISFTGDLRASALNSTHGVGGGDLLDTLPGEAGAGAVIQVGQSGDSRGASAGQVLAQAAPEAARSTGPDACFADESAMAQLAQESAAAVGEERWSNVASNSVVALLGLAAPLSGFWTSAEERSAAPLPTNSRRRRAVPGEAAGAGGEAGRWRLNRAGR